MHAPGPLPKDALTKRPEQPLAEIKAAKVATIIAGHEAALAGAVASLQDETHFQSCCQRIIASRERLVAGLEALGFEVLPSAANFIFARHADHEGAELAAALRTRAIIVRQFQKPRIHAFLRISIGTDAQCETLLAALREIMDTRP